MVNRSAYPRVGGRMYSTWLGGNMVVYPEGLGPANVYFVDASMASSGDGLSWERAYKTIMEAMDAITARGVLRGRSIVLVAPGGYNEDVITPLNSIAPFGQLIAVNPTPGKSFGATYIYAASGVGLTVKARGWLIAGFEIGAIANMRAIHLDGASANSNPAGVMLQDMIVSGWGAAGSIGIDVTGNGAPHATLRDIFFDGFLADAIRCSESGTDQPRYWELDRCRFVDNANHINMNPRGFKESWIHDCALMQIGANRTATIQLDNRGGNASIIGPNNFLSGDYDQGNGGYYAGTNETWRGNHSQDSENGSAQANPAA